jgi:hypothetical protein
LKTKAFRAVAASVRFAIRSTNEEINRKLLGDLVTSSDAHGCDRDVFRDKGEDLQDWCPYKEVLSALPFLFFFLTNCSGR